MRILTVMDWGWAEMLWVALISICLVFLVLLSAGVGHEALRLCLHAPLRPLRQPLPRSPEAAPGADRTTRRSPRSPRRSKLFRSELHDRESEVLTIMSIKRAYSPWNSKIHGLTPLPERK